MNISKEEIIRAEEELSRALALSDQDALERLLHDEVLIIAPRGNILTKDSDFQKPDKEIIFPDNGNHYLEDLSLFGDTAIAMLRFCEPSAGGTQYRYIRVWKRENGSIRVIGGSCTRLS